MFANLCEWKEKVVCFLNILMLHILLLFCWTSWAKDTRELVHAFFSYYYFFQLCFTFFRANVLRLVMCFVIQWNVPRQWVIVQWVCRPPEVFSEFTMTSPRWSWNAAFWCFQKVRILPEINEMSYVLVYSFVHVCVWEREDGRENAVNNMKLFFNLAEMQPTLLSVVFRILSVFGL